MLTVGYPYVLRPAGRPAGWPAASRPVPSCLDRTPISTRPVPPRYHPAQRPASRPGPVPCHHGRVPPPAGRSGPIPNGRPANRVPSPNHRPVPFRSVMSGPNAHPDPTRPVPPPSRPVGQSPPQRPAGPRPVLSWSGLAPGRPVGSASPPCVLRSFP